MDHIRPSTAVGEADPSKYKLLSNKNLRRLLKSQIKQDFSNIAERKQLEMDKHRAGIKQIMQNQLEKRQAEMDLEKQKEQEEIER